MSQNQQANPTAEDTVWGCQDALLEEYAALFCDWSDGAPPPRAKEWLRAHEAELRAHKKTALCLSGGGIRSAAFCLGALQALAAKGVLGEFNYMSTVSGGGYIGAWLWTIMRGGGLGNGALPAAIKALTDPTDTALRSLRNYTNYLIPSGGFASSDTWSAIVLWLRNVSLNWLVFGPVLFALAMAPLLYRELLWDISPSAGNVALIAGLGFLLIYTIMVCRSVPTHAYDTHVDLTRRRFGVAAGTVQLSIVTPVLVWAFLAPSWFSAAAAEQYDTVPFWSCRFAPASIGAFVTLLAGYVIGALTLPRRYRSGFVSNGLWWALGAALSAFLLHLGATLGQQVSARTLAVLGPLWVAGAQVTQSTLYVGLRRAAKYAELDREWLARLNGEKLIPALAWSVLAAVTLILPALVFEQWPATYAAVIGFASGPIGAWLGQSAKSFGAAASADKTGGAWWADMAREAAILAATLLFAATLFMLLGELGAIIVARLGAWLDLPSWPIALALIALLMLLSLGCGARININRFSLHGVYRNRLARAFIGTARPPAERRPDAYTRFDPGDNMRMQDLHQGKDQRGALFPVVNVTLNLLEGAPSGWAERKAAPFTITPLRSGAACLGKKDAEGNAEGRYIRTADYSGQESEAGRRDQQSGITLGTAITISGAAVSPTMGYHSSPATAFLMTLFNVRLGAWLPNPNIVRRWTAAKPSNALRPLFNEMLGRANDTRRDVYLSDGGHFDDLGLYEMLRRQCRYIVVIDAACDPEYHYVDLGRALRMASIDLYVTVEFISPLIKGEDDLDASGALARVRYHDGSSGLLLYLKPWRPKYLPADVLAYWADHEDFPHQSTAQQFFEESQFESYRALGQQIVARAFRVAGNLPDGNRLRQVFARAEIAARRALKEAQTPQRPE
jgi:hypothetical protein